MSKILKTTKETVSLEKLKENLPESCYEAITKTLDSCCVQNQNLAIDDSIYEQYFSAQPSKPLDDSERQELFEQLGNSFVKVHYSTETLRSFLSSEPSTKKGRK